MVRKKKGTAARLRCEVTETQINFMRYLAANGNKQAQHTMACFERRQIARRVTTV